MFFIVLLICGFIKISTGADSNNIIVQTSNGAVLGKVAKTIDQKKTYYAYQGIPYAQPPVGELRFRAPLPANKWDDVYNATYERDKCVQFFEGSEDCLHLSVYTPVYPVTTQLLPVMIWFFGGYFIYGEGSSKLFGPDFFIEENVLVVLFNYRLGIFGFLSTEDKASPGNYALKDQILVMKWVKENIKYFGGDPDSVTIFGESAGSASISYLVQSPLAKNLFHRAIMESGTTLNYFGFARSTKEVAILTSRLLGIDTNDTQELVDKLRQSDTGVLQAISLGANIGLSLWSNIRNGILFAPCREPESPEAVHTGKSHQLLEDGNFNKVPLIVGFNSQEGITIVQFLDYIRPYVISYDLFPTMLVPVDMNLENIDIKKIVGDVIKNYYFRWSPVIFSDQSLTQFITDDQIVRGVTEAVRLYSKHTEVFFYRYSYDSRFGLVDEYGQNEPGVGHEEEVYFLFNDSTRKQKPTLSDTLTRKRLVRLWTNFAKTGKPTPTKDPILENSIWVPATPTNLTYYDIGNNLSMKTDLRDYNIQWWFDIYNQYGIPPYDTY